MRFRITPTLTQVHQIHSNASNKWYKQHWRSQFRKQPPMLSHVLKYLLPKIRKDLLTASLSTHRWVDELWLFFWKDVVLFRLKSQILLSHLIKYLPTFKKIIWLHYPLPYQLTSFQPERQIISTTLLLAPPNSLTII